MEGFFMSLNNFILLYYNKKPKFNKKIHSDDYR